MPTFPKYITYLLIAILIIALACLFFAFTNKKDTDSQSDLLRAMAEKLRVENQSDKNESKHNKSEQAIAKTEEDEIQIIRIADIICFGEELDADEKKFYKRFKSDIDKELEYSRGTLSSIIEKFMSDKNDFSDDQKKYYEVNQEKIDYIIQHKKYFNSLIKKLIEGATDFSTEELQFQENYPKEIEAELKRLKKTSDNKLSKANPPLAAGERLKIILSLFDDGIPKIAAEIARLYAKKTDTKVHTGNMSGIIGKLVDDHKLLNVKIDSKFYLAPPEWFDGRKLKPEYKEKITKI